MTMTLAIAQSLDDWYEKSHKYKIEFTIRGRKVKYAVRYLDTQETLARQYLVAQCESALILTDSGWAVLESKLAETMAEVLAVIDQHSDQGEIDLIQKSIDSQDQKSKDSAKSVEIRSIPAEGVEWRLCDVSKVEAAKPQNKEEREQFMHRLLEDSSRWLPRIRKSDIQAVRALEHDFPNFASVVHYLSRQLQLRLLGAQSVYLPPVLLLGPPGVGKTAFASALARVLPLHLRIQSLAETSANWVLTGHHKGWLDAGVGVIARLAAECPFGRTPFLLLDELDKAAGDYRFAVDTALLSLLEPVTARTFRDENLDLTMDVTPMSYILTANRRERIRPEILSRVKVIEIGPPTQEQMPAIVRSVDRGLRDDLPQLDAFKPLDRRIIECLAAQPPRALKSLLLESYGIAVEREPGRSCGLELKEADIRRAEGGGGQACPPGKALQVQPRTWSLH